ncbi:hypothetical protein GTPT_3041 [Tatumella ptyseos ATCC 33301]|uniref:Uncharacterized protein n=1 Tax=Tatumella ptyseos ATCC 33301 TaxID=1005995 RepID=A0A085JAY8_9GAMM|nr:hypothetical protein GTPT_3041 [Tatumella ptyseos ATCC 33301]
MEELLKTGTVKVDISYTRVYRYIRVKELIFIRKIKYPGIFLAQFTDEIALLLILPPKSDPVQVKGSGRKNSGQSYSPAKKHRYTL